LLACPDVSLLPKCVRFCLIRGIAALQPRASELIHRPSSELNIPDSLLLLHRQEDHHTLWPTTLFPNTLHFIPTFTAWTIFSLFFGLFGLGVSQLQSRNCAVMDNRHEVVTWTLREVRIISRCIPSAGGPLPSARCEFSLLFPLSAWYVDSAQPPRRGGRDRWTGVFCIFVVLSDAPSPPSPLSSSTPKNERCTPHSGRNSQA